MIYVASLVLLGISAGTLSGLVGIGGGLIIVPSLIYIFGLPQHLAQGTSLALMVPPIGIIAAWTYFREGYVDLKVATFIILGFLIGSYIGSQTALALPSKTLAKILGFIMICVGIHLIIKNR